MHIFHVKNTPLSNKNMIYEEFNMRFHMGESYKIDISIILLDFAISPSHYNDFCIFKHDGTIILPKSS